MNDRPDGCERIPRPGCVALLLLLAVACGDPARRETAEIRAGGAGEVADALREPEPLARAEKLARALRATPPEALREVRRAYEGVYFDRGDVELVLLAEWWARFDAPGALAWSLVEFQAEAMQVQQAVLRAWAREDPEAAVEYVQAKGSGKTRALWLDAVLSGWEESSWPGMFEFVWAMPSGPQRQRALATVARRKVLREGVDGAFDWVEALSDDDPQRKLELLRRVGSAAAEIAPERAAERAAGLIPGPYADGLPRRVATRWARRDGEAAMRWLRSLPAGRERDDGIAESYRAWLRWSPEPAQRFMEGPSREDPAFDPAKAIHAQAIARARPHAALEVAQELRDEDERWATTGRVWRLWWLEDEDAANAWFEAHAEAIPEFYRERIRVIPLGLKRMREKNEKQEPASDP